MTEGVAMKTRRLNAAAIIFILAATAHCGTAPDTIAPKPGQHVIVSVNGIPITQEEIDADIEKKTAAAAKKMPAEQLAQLKERMQEKAVDNFITRTVLTIECDTNNITATDQEIDEALEEMTRTLPDDMSLEDALDSAGITLETLTNDITFGLRVNKLIEANVGDVPPPTEADMQDFYEKNKGSFAKPETVQARHILIRFSKDDDEAARAEKKTRIEALRTQLRNGADFAELAAEHSDCPSKNRGGNLGTFGRGRMVKAFEDAAFGQKINEIGPVVETSFGYHIIQVQSRKPAGQRSYDDVKNQIKTHLEQQNKNTAVRDYIENLKQKASIIYTDQ